VGERGTYDRLPYFFSDQYELGMEYVGHPEAGDQVVLRGDIESRELIADWHRDGLVIAPMHLNQWDVVNDLHAIVGSEERVDPARLADPDVPLGLLDG
jgi:3-phenylpropionate/trans-cinnamate dioxygenase ferredoxin reductase subunit